MSSIKNLRSYGAVVAAVFAVGFGLLAPARAQDEKLRRVNTSAIPNKNEINEALEKILKRQKGKVETGANLVLASKAGTRLYANGRRGKVVGFSITAPIATRPVVNVMPSINAECEWHRRELWPLLRDLLDALASGDEKAISEVAGKLHNLLDIIRGCETGTFLPQSSRSTDDIFDSCQYARAADWEVE